MDKKTEEALLNSTSIIKTIDKYGKMRTATCFFIRHIIDSKEVTFLVTNKHVLENKVRIILCIDYYNIENNTYTYNNSIDITLGKDIVFHPEYDLCILNLSFINKLNSNNKILSYATIGTGMIPIDYSIFKHIQPIIMTGYPNGIYNMSVNCPIARYGITSTSISDNYNNRNEFLIDIPSIGGSSGSPIFTEVDDKVYLIGIERGTFIRNIEYDEYKNRLYHSKKHKIEIDTQLGIAIRSDEIRNLLTQIH